MENITEEQIQHFPSHAAGRNALYRALEKKSFLLRDEKGEVRRVVLAEPLDFKQPTHTVYLIDNGVEFRRGDFDETLYVPKHHYETRLIKSAINDETLSKAKCRAWVHSYHTIVCEFMQARYIFTVDYQPDITSAWLELTLLSYHSPDYTWRHQVDDNTKRPTVPKTVKVLSKVAYQTHIQRMLYTGT